MPNRCDEGVSPISPTFQVVNFRLSNPSERRLVMVYTVYIYIYIHTVIEQKLDVGALQLVVWGQITGDHH